MLIRARKAGEGQLTLSKKFPVSSGGGEFRLPSLHSRAAPGPLSHTGQVTASIQHQRGSFTAPFLPGPLCFRLAVLSSFLTPTNTQMHIPTSWPPSYSIFAKCCAKHLPALSSFILLILRLRVVGDWPVPQINHAAGKWGHQASHPCQRLFFISTLCWFPCLKCPQ